MAEDCSNMASRVANAPHLRIRAVDVPATWREGESQMVVLELKKRGNALADNIRVRFGGNLVNRVGWTWHPPSPSE